MKTVIYHNPRWGKSRRSVELLKDKKENFTIIEYLKSPLKKETLKEIIGMLGLRASDIVRTSEKEFIEYNLSEILNNENKLLEAIETYPKIMQRPIIVHNGKAVIGRPPENIYQIIWNTIS